MENNSLNLKLNSSLFTGQQQTNKKLNHSVNGTVSLILGTKEITAYLQ